MSQLSAAATAGFVGVALDQNKLDGLLALMRAICDITDSDGTILWLCDNPRPSFERGHDLGILAQYPSDYRSPRVRLPMEGSCTGSAILDNAPLVVDDFRADGRVHRDHPFMADQSIDSFLILPLRFPSGQPGALNLYRLAGSPKFQESDKQAFAPIAMLLPKLHSMLADKVLADLRAEVEEALGSWPDRTDARVFPNTATQVAKACEAVTRAFAARETTVFLVDPDEPDRFTCAATSWPHPFSKTSYQPNQSEGATGWVLQHKRPVLVSDLRLLAQQADVIQNKYPGLRWRDSLDLLGIHASVLNASEGNGIDDKLPASWIAAPIVSGEKLLGVIRCCVTGVQPYVFTERELDLLRSVADQLGRFWKTAASAVELVRQAWSTVILSIGKLNSAVEDELSQPAPERSTIYDLLLQYASEIVPGGEIFDIRLFDKDRNDLYFAATLGPAWQSGSEEEQRRRREKRFSIKGKSAGAYVYRNKRTKVITDVSAEEFYSETFPETRQLIVSPIMHGRNVLGVLDIRKTDTIPFQPQSELAVDLLARQLALYHQLVENVRRISGSEERLKQSAEEQRSRSAIQAATYQNLEHQFKTPILKARRQMEQYLNRVGNSHVAEELQAVRSHLAQAYLIAYNTRLFADLAGDKPLNLSLKNMLAGSFVGLIREAGTENELVYAHTNQVKFRVHEDTFINNISGLTIDRSLFQHALWNVLDNAGKYSKSRTTVTISCGFTRRDRYFYISIQNTSRVPIRPEETARAVEREWQSPKVVSGDGPGSGIGLWIANNIMQAHGGEVAVSPTNHLDLTDVRLLISGSLVTKRG